MHFALFATIEGLAIPAGHPYAETHRREGASKMAIISLSTYTIRVRNEARKIVPLDNFCGGRDLLDLLRAHLTVLRTQYTHDPEHKKLLRVSELRDHDRKLEGIIETGEYGYESSLYDVDLHRVSYNRRACEAEMLPFYFLADIPTASDEGILVLQRFKQFGIRKIFAESFKAYLAAECPDFTVAMSPLIPEELVRQYLRGGRIVKIRFVEFTVPTDIADAYDKGGHVEEGGHLELVLFARRNSHIPISRRVEQFLNNRRPINKLIELEHFDYQNVKLEVDFEGTHRTVDLSNLHRLRAYYDVSTKVQLGTGGHPVFESISGVGKELLGDLGRAIRRDS